ncbi:MAG: holo-ACP synthase [Halioglobus sp.]
MIAVGTDILQINRIAEVVDRQGDKFAQRILAPQELQEYRDSKLGLRLLAKRYAAKEAVSKCLGTGIGRGVSWQHILIDHDDMGAPVVILSEGAAAAAHVKGGNRIALSISDESDYVVAFAVLWRDDGLK